MHVYFVRHGETFLNRQHIHQSPNTPLSPKGREDIVTTSEFLRSVNPDFLVSSEYTRALESARIIGTHVGLTPHTNGLFYEIERPSKFFHMSLFSLETMWYVLLLLLHMHNPSWRYADAENISDISNRAQRALRYLESLAETHHSVVVVSHSVFMQAMVSCIQNGTKPTLTFFDLVRMFVRIWYTKNGSVIHMEYSRPTNADTYTWRYVV